MDGISRGLAAAAAPITNRQFRTSAPTILPTVISGWPRLIAAIAVINSGKDVPKATIVAAMTPQNVLRYLEPGSLVITPGDRVDNILLAMSADRMARPEAGDKVAGIILTGGLMPHMAVMPLVKSSGLPVLLCQEDTFTVSSRISQRVFKIDPGDTEKIEAAQGFVREYVDMDAVLPLLEKEA